MYGPKWKKTKTKKKQNIGTKSAFMPTLKEYTFSSTNNKLRRECTF